MLAMRAVTLNFYCFASFFNVRIRILTIKTQTLHFQIQNRLLPNVNFLISSVDPETHPCYILFCTNFTYNQKCSRNLYGKQVLQCIITWGRWKAGSYSFILLYLMQFQMRQVYVLIFKDLYRSQHIFFRY